jgi:hypothetical protein
MIREKFIDTEVKIMKGIILSGLSLLLASAFYSPSAKAQFTEPPYMVQPVNLVYLGYQGYFDKEGIPSNSSFIDGIQSGKITAMTLVESAIQENRLPAETIHDTNYLNNVRDALRGIDHD